MGSQHWIRKYLLWYYVSTIDSRGEVSTYMAPEGRCKLKRRVGLPVALLPRISSMPPPKKILPYAALRDPNPVVCLFTAGSPTLGTGPNQYHDSISNVRTKVHRSLPFLVWVSRAYVTCWEVSTNAIGPPFLRHRLRSCRPRTSKLGKTYSRLLCMR
ncbi:hypothetical protein ARMGADRAFT_685508 [Armillaria gallica]|uniref:Uncharacterized protein n=1 Tax=Armillaria gallica TaxID=47427 RepID=A0A2H3D192_ARMGA|nr:hypothetical protein ARMGADRAFT_685508 [Armillaria gallica]